MFRLKGPKYLSETGWESHARSEGMSVMQAKLMRLLLTVSIMFSLLLVISSLANATGRHGLPTTSMEVATVSLHPTFDMKERVTIFRPSKDATYSTTLPLWEFIEAPDSDNSGLINELLWRFEYDLHAKDRNLTRTKAYIAKTLAARPHEKGLPQDQPWRYIESNDNFNANLVYGLLEAMDKDINNGDQSFRMTVLYARNIPREMPSFPSGYLLASLNVRWEDQDGHEIIPPRTLPLGDQVLSADNTCLHRASGFADNLAKDTRHGDPSFHLTHEFIDGRKW